MSWQQRCQTIQLLSDPKALFWIVDLQEISNIEAQEAQYFLDIDSTQRSQRFIFEQDRNRYLIAHAFLRAKLGELNGQRPSEISLLRNQHGKPYVEENKVYFNLSHTKSKAFFGFHFSCPIGVDIEDINRQISVKIAGDPKQDLETFLRVWCAEEAYLKAIGTGFTSQRPKLDCVSSFQGIDFFRKDDAKIHVYNELVSECKLAVCILD